MGNQANRNTRTIEIGDARFAIDDHNDASTDRLPLLLLHGAVQSRQAWDAQWEVFKGGRRLIVPDLRGHGDTTGPVDNMSIEAHARDMVALLDALEVERVVVCGVSLGGMVALSIAVAAPGRVAGLVLADTPLALSLTGWVRDVLRTIGPQRLLWPVFKLLGRRRTARMGLTLARLILGTEWVGPKAGELFVEGFSVMSREAIVETYAAIVAANPIIAESTDCPSLVILGQHETQLVVSQAGEIARRLGHSEIVTVGGGHVPNIDAPDEFNAAVEGFLDRVENGNEW